MTVNNSPLILVADDERLSRILLRRLLTQSGYRFLEVKDGEECLGAYREHQPDMVLLDAMMPVRDGFSCCEEIRKLPDSDRVPILMITGLDDKESVDRAFQAGATDYITKPIHAPVLMRRLRRLLEASHAERELQRKNQVLEAELKAAADYVRSLLPLPVKTPQVQIEQEFIPSLALGGDAFDYYWLDSNHLVIYLLDVSGHGIRSALLSVSVLTLLRSKLSPTNLSCQLSSLEKVDFYQPEMILRELNRVFLSETDEDYFTIWYGIYNTKTQRLTYASAGHPPALLIQDSHVEELNTKGIPIGMFPEVDYQASDMIVPENSSLYIFSDGVYEIPQTNGEIWGLDNLKHLLVSQWKTKATLNLDNLSQKILELSGNNDLPDDFSLLQIAFSQSNNK